MTVQGECVPALWNDKAGRTTSTKESGRLLNSHLEGFITRANLNQTDLIQNQRPVTARAIVNRLPGKPDKSRMLVSIFENHNKEMKQLVDKEYSSSTLYRYETSLQHVVNFIQWKFGVTDIDVKMINHEFLTDFNFYLRTEKKCNNNSTVKYIRNFGKIIRICLYNGWLTKDPFRKPCSQNISICCYLR